MTDLDETHDPSLRSWVPSANGHPDFPIQNLPFGVFSLRAGEARGGVAIGDQILDLSEALAAGVFHDEARHSAEHASAPPLNGLFALGSGPRRALRKRLVDLLRAGSEAQNTLRRALYDASDCDLHLPACVGDYTDFYVGIHHATNVGKLFRPDNPLLPNYKHIPIGYHGRASSLRPSGAPVIRPRGQSKAPGAPGPTFGPTQRLDYELELGIWVGAGNDLGAPIPVASATNHVAGYCLLNDWSARDFQAWEYQPLGPFLSKNFATTLSAWVVTPEALAPFKVAQAERPQGDPTALPYLLDATDQRHGAFDLELEVLLVTPRLNEMGLQPHRLALSNARHMYWTAAQMIAHHTSGGCNLRPGDLLGTGTISSPDHDGCGSLLEATLGGRSPITLASGEQRTFLEDGDEVMLRARGRKDGFASIGFGECRARILPSS